MTGNQALIHCAPHCVNHLAGAVLRWNLFPVPIGCGKRWMDENFSVVLSLEFLLLEEVFGDAL